MIRIEQFALLAAVLLLSSCDRDGKADRAVQLNGISREAAQERQPRQPHQANSSVERASAPTSPPPGRLPEAVLEKKDIMVTGDPACALTVRYGEGIEQPVTWRGEGCAELLIRMSSIDDLRRIGQETKLDGEMLEDLARMPGSRALYIEGAHSSALYPENVMHRIYEVPLAD